jgi:hypothetical protein
LGAWALTDDGAYEAAIVCQFVKTLGLRLTASHRDMLVRWSARDTVSLAKVDAFLHRYGLMTWELEDWATQEFGRSGYLTPRDEFLKELSNSNYSGWE